MDTATRQHVRGMAYTMEATYRGDPNGLQEVQAHAWWAVASLRDAFPGETDDTLCCVARALANTAARLASLPVPQAGSALESMITAYPLAAGALAGVYLLPEDAPGTGHPAPGPPPSAVPADDLPGQYL